MLSPWERARSRSAADLGALPPYSLFQPHRAISHPTLPGRRPPGICTRFPLCSSFDVTVVLGASRVANSPSAYLLRPGAKQPKWPWMGDEMPLCHSQDARKGKRRIPNSGAGVDGDVTPDQDSMNSLACDRGRVVVEHAHAFSLRQLGMSVP